VNNKRYGGSCHFTEHGGCQETAKNRAEGISFTCELRRESMRAAWSGMLVQAEAEAERLLAGYLLRLGLAGGSA
jgi:hypothetical protein